MRVDDDPGLAKDGRDLELPPWNKGRYGTAIGRAVHATLQTIELATGHARHLVVADAPGGRRLGTGELRLGVLRAPGRTPERERRGDG